MNRFAVIVAAVCLLIAGSAFAQGSFTLQPFEYDPNNACDITAQWQNGAIVLAKNCTTATEAAAGIDIVSPLEGQDVSTLTELNFEYQNGGHCGAGAPRFNVTVAGRVAESQSRKVAEGHRLSFATLRRCDSGQCVSYVVSHRGGNH